MLTLRHFVVFVLCFVTLFAMANEADTLEAVIISRAIGILLCIVIYLLVRHWRKQGHLKIED